MVQRNVILHYHLFKNAGTSVDSAFKQSFGARWVTREFSMAGLNNSAQLASWIADTPEAVVFSSHTAAGPIPRIPGTRVLTVMMLRDPIERIRSAYHFERRQDDEGYGAQLARTNDFEGYVRARLEKRGDRQCRNFQTQRLASLRPGPEPEIERAVAAARQIDVLGRVEQFGDAMAALARAVRPHYPDFSFQTVHANRSERPELSEAPAFLDLLRESNRLDLELLSQIEASRNAEVG